MPRGSEYIYDPVTGTWKKRPSTDDDNNSGDESPKKDKEGDNLTTPDPDKDNSAGSVGKQYNTIELNTLSGTLNFIVTEETIKLRAGDTVSLQGIGKHLSGSYYVKDITRQISNNGYSHSATLIKTDFGKSLKITTDTTQKKTESSSVPSSPQASNAQRTYTVKKGDTLWKIAKQYYGNGALYNKIFDANTKQIANPNLIYVGQVFVIP